MEATTPRVPILGANGQLARHTTKFFLERTDARLTLYLRQSGRLRNPHPARVAVVQGDVLGRPALKAAMQGQDLVYASLAGAMARQAQALVESMLATGLKRLIFSIVKLALSPTLELRHGLGVSRP